MKTMTILEQLDQVKAMQNTIDKMLERGTMELRNVKHRGVESPANKWILEPLHEDDNCSVGFVTIPHVEIGQCETHVHPGSREFLIVIKGSIIFNVDGRDLRVVREGECCVVEAGCMHHSKPLTDDTRMVYVCIPRDASIPTLDVEIKKHGE
jgi:quercetin dioxygenase-like cupin family protein